MKKILLAGMLVTLLATSVDARGRRARRRAARQGRNVHTNTVRSYNNFAQMPMASTENLAVAARVTSLKPVVDASLLSKEKTEPIVVAVADVAEPIPTVTDASAALEDANSTGNDLATPVIIAPTPVIAQPIASQAAAPINSAMAELNSIRTRRGLPAFIEDPNLSAVAYGKALIQAQRRAMYHPGGSMGGARFEGVGMGLQFATCYLYATHSTYAGAASVTGADGQRYHCLLLK